MLVQSTIITPIFQITETNETCTEECDRETRLACITEYAFNMQTQGLPNTLPWTQFLNPTERLNWTAAGNLAGAGFLLIERVWKGHLVIKLKQRRSSNYQINHSSSIEEEKMKSGGND